MSGVDLLDLLWLSLLGGWVAADSTSFGQFMVSRPLVAATLAGAVVGRPMDGAMIGVVLEAFHLGVLPVGAARFPESGPAAAVAGGAYAAGPSTPSSMALIVAFALLWEWVCGQSVHQLRQFNVHIVVGPGRGGEGEMQRRHLSALGIDFLRGVLLFVVGWALLDPALRVLTPRWGLGEPLTGLIMGGVLVGLLASSWRILGGRVRWFVAGALGGVALLLATS